MIIPKEIKGKNRMRDWVICQDYISGKSAIEIIQERKLDLKLRRVQAIISENAEYINPRVAWPKSKRIWELQRMYSEAPKSKKDKADLLEQIRKEVEGDKPTINVEANINSKHLVQIIHNHANKIEEVAEEDSEEIEYFGGNGGLNGGNGNGHRTRKSLEVIE